MNRLQRSFAHRMTVWLVLLALASYGFTGVLQEFASASINTGRSRGGR